MMLDFTETRRLLENYIAANYTETSVKFENVPLQTEGLDEWVAVFDMPTFSESTGMGEDSFHNGGVLIIQIFTTLDTGTDRSREIAVEMSDVLLGKDIGGIQLDVPELHKAPPNASWFQQNLQIHYNVIMGQEQYC